MASRASSNMWLAAGEQAGNIGRTMMQLLADREARDERAEERAYRRERDRIADQRYEEQQGAALAETQRNLEREGYVTPKWVPVPDTGVTRPNLAPDWPGIGLAAGTKPAPGMGERIRSMLGSTELPRMQEYVLTEGGFDPTRSLEHRRREAEIRQQVDALTRAGIDANAAEAAVRMPSLADRVLPPPTSEQARTNDALARYHAEAADTRRRNQALTRITNMLAAGADPVQVNQAMSTYKDLAGYWNPDDIESVRRRMGGGGRDAAFDERRRSLIQMLGRGPMTEFEQQVVDALAHGASKDQVLEDMRKAGVPESMIEQANRYLRPLR